MDALYARQSVDKKDSISIEAQLEKCACESGGNYMVFSDKGFSGKNFNRPSFKNMLQCVREGKIHRIIVYRLDRLSRSIADFSVFWNILEKNGVEFLSVNERFDTATPIGRAMLYIIMSFAQLERETIAERIRDNYYARFKRGVWTGGPAPVGFDIIKNSSDGRRASFLCANSEAELVKLIFNLYSSGLSLGKTAKKVSEGLMEKKRYWDSRAVSRIIRNPVYAMCSGDIYWYYAEKGIEIENDISDFDGTRGAMLTGKEGGKCLPKLSIAGHDGIIDPQIFLYCNRRLDMNSTVCGGQKSRYSFVSGLLRCGLCQSSVKVVMSQGKRYIFCSKGCCGLKGCDLEGLEDTVLNTVKEAVKRYMPCENQPDRADEIDFRIKNLVKAIEEGGVSAKYINERINFLENEKNNIVCQAGGKKPVVDFSDIMDNDYKRGIIRAAVEKIVIRENTLEIFYRF